MFFTILFFVNKTCYFSEYHILKALILQNIEENDENVGGASLTLWNIGENEIAENYNDLGDTNPKEIF